MDPEMLKVWEEFAKALPNGGDGIQLGPNGEPLVVAQTAGDPDQWYTLEDGTQVQEKDLLPGDKGYKSAPLVDGGRKTDKGDVFNPFRGYVSGQGGTFGDPNATVDEDTRLRLLLGNPGFSVQSNEGQDFLRKALASGNAETRAIAAQRVATASGRQDFGDVGMGGNPNLLGYQFFDSLTPEQLKAAGVNDFARHYGRSQSQTAAALGKGYTVANGRLLNRMGQDVGALGDEAKLGMDPEYLKARTEALQAQARPVQSATQPAAQGFGTGWQNPYANYRPVQPAANPIGSPGLNKVQARPLTGGAY